MGFNPLDVLSGITGASASTESLLGNISNPLSSAIAAVSNNEIQPNASSSAPAPASTLTQVASTSAPSANKTSMPTFVAPVVHYGSSSTSSLGGVSQTLANPSNEKLG